MAKPLSAKSMLIREAIDKNPELKNKEIAELLNGSEDRKKDKIEVTPADIAQQKQQMKKTPASAEPKAVMPEPTAPTKVPTKRGRPKGSGGRPKMTAAAPVAKQGSNLVDLIDGVLSLAHRSGGMDQLKRLVNRLAELER